jgi:hypothetical protein
MNFRIAEFADVEWVSLNIHINRECGMEESGHSAAAAIEFFSFYPG